MHVLLYHIYPAYISKKRIYLYDVYLALGKKRMRLVFFLCDVMYLMSDFVYAVEQDQCCFFDLDSGVCICMQVVVCRLERGERREKKD